jgi:hypothetical protein
MDAANWLVSEGATFTSRLLEDGRALTMQNPWGTEHFANALAKALD